MAGPLKGIRVIDATIWQVGPVGTEMLADLGAEVIKIEAPVQGDPGRGLTHVGGNVSIELPYGESAYFEVCNRGKKGVTINLKHERGREVFYRIVEKSDIVVQNMRQGVATKLGIDYETLRQFNSQLIYVSASGFGAKGPHSSNPAFDPLGQARSGLNYAFGEPESPPVHGIGGIGDQITSIMVAYGAVTALVARERQGIGQQVDVSLLSSSMWLLGLGIGLSLIIKGWEWPRFSQKSGSPTWNYYRCGDGQWIFLCVQQDKYWHDLCLVLQLDALENDPRFRNRDKRFENYEELIRIFDAAFATRPREEWEEMLASRGIPAANIQTITELASDPQVIANQYIVDFDHPTYGKIKLLNSPTQFSRTPAEPRATAPQLGQHTEEVLLDIGYTWDDIVGLRECGAI